MKTLAAFLLATAFATAAHAQSGTNVAPGQTPANTINQAFFMSNTDPVGFGEQSLAVGIAGAGNSQATATVLPTRASVVTCAAGTGVMLPAVQRYTPIVILNRGSAACLIYPTVGAYLETVPGTLGAVNASVSLAAGADVTFRPAIVGAQTEWLQ